MKKQNVIGLCIIAGIALLGAVVLCVSGYSGSKVNSVISFDRYVEKGLAGPVYAAKDRRAHPEMYK